MEGPKPWLPQKTRTPPGLMRIKPRIPPRPRRFRRAWEQLTPWARAFPQGVPFQARRSHQPDDLTQVKAGNWQSQPPFTSEFERWRRRHLLRSWDERMASITPFSRGEWLTSPGASSSTCGPSWITCLLRAGLTISLGLAALLFPFSALVAFTFVFATFAFVEGLFSVLAGISAVWRGRGRAGLPIFRGIIGMVLGAAFLAMPLLATFSSSLVALTMLAAWVTITGVAEVRSAIRHRKEMKSEWVLIIAGSLSVLLGIAIPVALMLSRKASFRSPGLSASTRCSPASRFFGERSASGAFSGGRSNEMGLARGLHGDPRVAPIRPR